MSKGTDPRIEKDIEVVWFRCKRIEIRRRKRSVKRIVNIYFDDFRIADQLRIDENKMKAPTSQQV